MAITPTPNNSLFKGFVFDGIDSRDYGVYISGDAVFNAPERDVEMIEIPGRNGAFALDKGRFFNIEVAYPAGLFGATEADFAAGINALRNALASRKGYCRLEDDYNPNEYRMAVYKSGLDVTPAMLKAGKFDIVFECKPQRFLKSGETEQTVTSGGTLTNPTLFESRPLLQVDGYGTIGINSDTLTVYNIELGDISLPWTCTINDPNPFGLTYSYTFGNTEFLNTGDAITFETRKLLGGASVQVSGSMWESFGGSNFTENITSGGGSVEKDQYWASNGEGIGDGTTSFKISPSYYFKLKKTLIYGTASTTDYTVSYTLNWHTAGGTAKSGNVSETFRMSYDGDTSVVISYIQPTVASTMTLTGYGWPMYQKIDTFNAYSTKSLNGTLYFDLDIGEAYTIEGGQITSANNVVVIPAELPTLKAGVNTFTYDNTITDFKVVPRWWEV